LGYFLRVYGYALILPKNGSGYILGDLKKLRLVTLVVDGLQHQEPGKKIF
jgi:hypothetical protein